MTGGGWEWGGTAAMITYEENGFPVELLSSRDIERAIRQGKLRPETIVTDHREDGSRHIGRADEVARLRPAFGLRDEAPTAEDSRPVSEPDVPVAEQEPGLPPDLLEPEAEDDGWPEVPDGEERAADGAEFDEPFEPAPMPAPRGGLTVGLAILATVLAGLLVLALVSRGGSSGGSDGSTANGATATVSATDVVGVETSYWTVRQVMVRQAPSASAVALGSIARGELFRGVPVRGTRDKADWVRIEAGPSAGGFVWAQNLATRERPQLEAELQQTMTLVTAAALRAEPDTASVTLRDLAAGSSVKVAGRTVSGWWEIAVDGGGVGYVEPGAIGGGCVGRDCRVLTADGWGGITAGMTVEEAERAAGVSLSRPGSYDEAFADEPGRILACNIHGVSGVPGNLGVFVENGIVTSVFAGISNESDAAPFRTDRGVALGDSEQAVRDAYAGLQEEPDIYSEPPDKKLFYKAGNGHGIKFSIGGGKVTEIAVGGRSINYVEGCL